MDNPIISEDLNILFKGNRDYLNGSDIFSAIFEKIGKKIDLSEVSDVDFSVHQMMHSDVLLDLHEDVDVLDNEVQAILKFKVGSKSYTGVIRENGKVITNRTEYDENMIMEKCRISLKNNSIHLEREKIKYTTLDLLTSMNKKLLTEIKPEITGKWIFVKIQSIKVPNLFQHESLTVKLERIFSNKYTKSSISAGEEKIGYLYFSIV